MAFLYLAVLRMNTLDSFYIRQQDEKRKRFEDCFMTQINGPSGKYEYILEWPGARTIYTKIMRCFKTDSGKWYIEVDDGNGKYFSKEFDTLEEAKEELYRKGAR